MKKLIVATVLVGLMSSGASALPVDPLFVAADLVNPNEQLEFRNGKKGAADWEIGLGQNTQVAGQFNTAQGPYTDISRIIDWQVGTAYDFSYKIDSSLNATFTMGNISLTYGNMNLGNTLQIHAKRGVIVTFGSETATGDTSNAFGTDYRYLTIDPVNGFNLSGSITFTQASSSGSTDGVTIRTGNRPTAVPDGGLTALLLGLSSLCLAGVRRLVA